MNKKCLSCIHCEVCSFIDSDTAKLEACDFYFEGCEVLEDIKTEIEECWQMYEDRFDVGDCLDIIDKHISGKESE